MVIFHSYVSLPEGNWGAHIVVFVCHWLSIPLSPDGFPPKGSESENHLSSTIMNYH